MSCIILPADSAGIAQATERLKNKLLVAFPTETVYGLGADARHDLAVAEIYAAKGRPSFNPLIVHVASVAEAKKYAVFTSLAEKLAEAFWPGPMTLVLNRVDHCALSRLVSAGMDTVAIRIPSHPVALQLLKASGAPIAAPSANRSGRVSPTLAKHVIEEFREQKELLVLDGGACQVGLESSVIDARGPKPIILRPGFVTAEDIQLNCMVVAQSTGGSNHSNPASPGMLESHYAPDLPIRLNATIAQVGEFMLAFGPTASTGKDVLNLSPVGDLKEAAANLFSFLRRADMPNYERIAVMPIPESGLGIAINDRLRRAASPR